MKRLRLYHCCFKICYWLLLVDIGECCSNVECWLNIWLSMWLNRLSVSVESYKSQMPVKSGSMDRDLFQIRKCPGIPASRPHKPDIGRCYYMNVLKVV